MTTTQGEVTQFIVGQPVHIMSMVRGHPLPLRIRQAVVVKRTPEHIWVSHPEAAPVKYLTNGKSAWNTGDFFVQAIPSII